MTTIKSIEEKAKRYDELLVKLQKAKVDNNVCDDRYCCVIDDIVPELKESEGERIRKMLIEQMERWHECAIENNVVQDIKDSADAIVWLEKQGEQKSIEWHREDEQNLNACLGYIPDEYLRRWLMDAIHAKYDKPADKVELKFKVGDEIKTTNEEPLTITKIDEKGYWSEDLFICDFGDAAKWKLVEQNPTWSKEDENMLRRAIIAIDYLGYLKSNHEQYYHGISDWLKSVRDKVQPQPKQEWSGGDDYVIERLFCLLDNEQDKYSQLSSDFQEIEEIKNKLNFLKDRYTWKPSDEQMKILNEVLNFAANHESPHWNDYIFGTLNNLIGQLKKLREE